MNLDGHWLTISEYSNYRNISISTIRRYIKTKKVVYKKENGKYIIFVSYENFKKRKNKEIRYKDELNKADEEMKKLREKNIELEMLIKIYEERIYEKSNNIIN